MEEPTFSDKFLTCNECGNDFVFTVGQQRMSHEEHGEVVDPHYCPVCSVKIERMGPRARSEEVPPTANGREMARATSNGDHGPRSTANPIPDYGFEADPSPNRPTDYQSGEAHPLHGHGGEVYEGSVKWFNDRKGFGFITLDNDVEIFVHYSGIAGEGYKTLKQEQRVRVTIEDTPKGPQATEVTALEPAPQAAATASDEDESEPYEDDEGDEQPQPAEMSES